MEVLVVRQLSQSQTHLKVQYIPPNMGKGVFGLFHSGFLKDPLDIFTHILQGCSKDTKAILWLFRITC